jgi:hypothetical protein
VVLILNFLIFFNILLFGWWIRSIKPSLHNIYTSSSKPFTICILFQRSGALNKKLSSSGNWRHVVTMGSRMSQNGADVSKMVERTSIMINAPVRPTYQGWIWTQLGWRNWFRRPDGLQCELLSEGLCMAVSAGARFQMWQSF